MEVKVEVEEVRGTGGRRALEVPGHVLRSEPNLAAKLTSPADCSL